jgi:hypothetical protein
MSRLARGPYDYYRPGDWNIICSICGTKLKFGDAVQNWQGQWRHVRCNEERPPQDFVHSINSREMAIPVVQKMGEIDVQICTFNGISAIPGYALPGCSIPGRTIIDPLNPPTELG